MDRKQLLAQVPELERALLTRQVRADVQRLDDLLADDFREIGASGRMFDKPEVLATLPQEDGAAPQMDAVIALRWLGVDSAQLLFRTTSVVDGQTVHALRSSLWRLHDGRWRMFFHQGSRVPPA